MTAIKPKTRRHFTSAAWAAAAVARQLKKESPIARGAPELFIVRLPPTQKFGWEIRRFGGILLEKSSSEFESMPAARAEGEKVLGAFMAQTSEV